MMKWACITEKCLSLVLHGRELAFMYLTHFTNQIFWIFKSSWLKSVWDETLDLQILWDNQQAWLLLLLQIFPLIPQFPLSQVSYTLWSHDGWLTSMCVCVCVCFHFIPTYSCNWGSWNINNFSNSKTLGYQTQKQRQSRGRGHKEKDALELQ